MITFKTDKEIAKMREGGKISARILQEVLRAAQAGVSLKELDALAEQRIASAGAKPSFKGFEGYPFATCLNVNDGVVHGLPTGYILQAGDLLSVDLGVFFKGFHTDTAWTILIGRKNESGKEKQAFLAAGEKALAQALLATRPGRYLTDISAAMQKTVEAAGFQVVRDLTGHGIGTQLHEEPTLLCYGPPSLKLRGGVPPDGGLRLQPGLTLAIEVIYVQHSPALKKDPDGWTLRTRDGGWGGLFEQTVALNPPTL